jgi:hypothetical protein
MAIVSPIQNTVATLNGLFKEKYADKVMNLIPDNVCVLNMVDFVGQDKVTGNLFHQPVVLGSEHGMTYGGSDGTAFTLNDAIAGQVKDATVQGYEFLLRTQISYAAASRSASSSAAFERGTKLIVANMIRSFAKRLEACLLYGQKELAKANGAMVSTALTIAKADWAPGIWVGAEKGIVDIYDSTLATLRGTAQITGVNLETRVLTLDSNIATVVAGDRIFWKGAKGNEFKGLHSIMTETSSLFGISPTAYSLFKSVEYDAGAAQLSFSKIQSAIARGVEKGLDEDVVCLVNPRTWAKLLTDQAALRMYDSSYSTSKAENGSQSIKFYAQNGVVEIRPCTYMKESLAMIVPPKELMRVGSTDVTFNLPGREGGQENFFLELQSASGYELRAYSDQALFCPAPAKLIIIYNVDNDA